MPLTDSRQEVRDARRLISEVLSETSGEFSPPELIDAVRRRGRDFSRDAVMSAVWALINQGEAELTAKGTVRRASPAVASTTRRGAEG